MGSETENSSEMKCGDEKSSENCDLPVKTLNLFLGFQSDTFWRLSCFESHIKTVERQLSLYLAKAFGQFFPMLFFFVLFLTPIQFKNGAKQG